MAHRGATALASKCTLAAARAVSPERATPAFGHTRDDIWALAAVG